MTAVTRFLGRATFPLLVVLLIVGTAGRVVAERPAAVDTTWTVVATGLINPKGLAFAPDGTLYVAESGKPGEVDVPLPVNFGGKGPIGTNARISRVRPGAGREDFVTGLPNVGLYGGVEMLGAASVASLNGQLYEVAAGHMTVSPKLSRVAPNGTMTAIADVGAYNNANPPPASNGDAVPLGNPYDLIALDGNLYITDGNYNRVLKATPDGTLRILAAWPNSPVTVGGTAGPDGNLYVAQFSPAPYNPGTGRIDRVALDGTITEGVVKGLTTPIDVAFAPDGTMYVLRYAAEFSPEKLRYLPFGGEVQRVKPDGTVEPVVTNLVFPTSLEFGRDGALYVTNFGNEANEGQGQVLRVLPGDRPVKGPEVMAPDDTRSYVAPQNTPAARPDSSLVAARVDFVEPTNSDEWGYAPASVTIQTGQAVLFTNKGRVAHTATGAQGDFDTGLLKANESLPVRFDLPGTFNYICAPHPWMKGTIIVQGAPKAVPGPPAATAIGGDTSPAIGPARAGLFVGSILVVIFAAGFALRRRGPAPTAAPPSSDD